MSCCPIDVRCTRIIRKGFSGVSKRKRNTLNVVERLIFCCHRDSQDHNSTRSRMLIHNLQQELVANDKTLKNIVIGRV